MEEAVGSEQEPLMETANSTSSNTNHYGGTTTDDNDTTSRRGMPPRRDTVASSSSSTTLGLLFTSMRSLQSFSSTGPGRRPPLGAKSASSRNATTTSSSTSTMASSVVPPLTNNTANHTNNNNNPGGRHRHRHTVSLSSIVVDVARGVSHAVVQEVETLHHGLVEELQQAAAATTVPEAPLQQQQQEDPTSIPHSSNSNSPAPSSVGSSSAHHHYPPPLTQPPEEPAAETNTPFLFLEMGLARNLSILPGDVVDAAAAAASPLPHPAHRHAHHRHSHSMSVVSTSGAAGGWATTHRPSVAAQHQQHHHHRRSRTSQTPLLTTGKHHQSQRPSLMNSPLSWANTSWRRRSNRRIHHRRSSSSVKSASPAAAITTTLSQPQQAPVPPPPPPESPWQWSPFRLGATQRQASSASLIFTNTTQDEEDKGSTNIPPPPSSSSVYEYFTAGTPSSIRWTDSHEMPSNDTAEPPASHDEDDDEDASSLDSNDSSLWGAHIDNDGIPVSAYLLLLSAVLSLSAVGPLLQLQHDAPAILKVSWKAAGTALFLFPFALYHVLWGSSPQQPEHEQSQKKKKNKTNPDDKEENEDDDAWWLQWLQQAIRLGVTAFTYTIFVVCFGLALDYTTVGNAVILGNSQSLLLLVGKFVVGHAVTPLETLGALIAFLGALCCSKDSSESNATDDDTSSSSSNYSTLMGDGLALLSALGGAVYIVSAKSVRSQMNVYVFMFLNMFQTAIYSLLMAYWFSGTRITLNRHINHGAFGWLHVQAWDRFPLEVLLVVVCNVLGAMGYVRAMQYFDALVISVAALMEPVVAELLACLMGVSALPGWMGWMGNALVIVGTFAVVYKPTTTNPVLSSSESQPLLPPQHNGKDKGSHPNELGVESIQE